MGMCQNHILRGLDHKQELVQTPGNPRGGGGRVVSRGVKGSIHPIGLSLCAVPLDKSWNTSKSNAAVMMATEDPGADTEPKHADWTPKENEAIPGASINLHMPMLLIIHIHPLFISEKLKQTYNAIVTYCSKSVHSSKCTHEALLQQGLGVSGVLGGIFHRGDATGAHTFHAGASNPALVVDTNGSSISGTTPTPLAPVGDSTPTSTMPVGCPATIANPPASDPPTSTLGGK
ncbi:hypothetical protein EDC04DRAFT_2608654 [Pisolithus marmoratus]|nr:hypothetical protein EDC04DRAFT_2608654 [Pisolithus marmoratus]